MSAGDYSVIRIIPYVFLRPIKNTIIYDNKKAHNIIVYIDDGVHNNADIINVP